MIKYIGGALLIVAGVLLGNSVRSIYRERVDILERFDVFVSFCESEITFYKKELHEIIDKFRAENNIYDEMIFTPDRKNSRVTPEMGKMFSSFFSGLQELDAESQKGFFKETKDKVERFLKKAEKDMDSKGKMVQKLFPVAAIGIFILTL